MGVDERDAPRGHGRARLGRGRLSDGVHPLYNWYVTRDGDAVDPFYVRC